MSGVKERYVSITESEWRRVCSQVARVTSLENNNRALSGLLEANGRALDEQTNRVNTLTNNIRFMNEKMDKQEQAANAQIQSLRVSLQSAVKDANSRIAALNAQHERELTGMKNDFTDKLGQLKDETTGMIKENNRRIEAAMNANNQRIYEDMNTMRAQLSADISAVRGQVDNLEQQVARHAQDQETLLEMAREYYVQAAVVIEEICNNYRVELLCPGRLQSLQHVQGNAMKEIEMAEKMPANASVARLEARNTMEQALQLYQEVVLAEQEWNLHYQAACQVLNATEAQLETSRELNLPDVEKPVDVAHWSNGDLSELERSLRALQDMVKTPSELTLDNLDSIRDAGMEVSDEIADVAAFAGAAFYASQDRADISQDVANAMKERLGLEIKDYNYEGTDQRGAYRLRLRNEQTGFEMVVSSRPQVQENGCVGNVVETDIISHGTLSTEQGGDAVKEALEALDDLGFGNSDVRTLPGYENCDSDRAERANIAEFASVNKPQVPNLGVRVQIPATGKQGAAAGKPNQATTKPIGAAN